MALSWRRWIISRFFRLVSWIERFDGIYTRQARPNASYRLRLHFGTCFGSRALDLDRWIDQTARDVIGQCALDGWWLNPAPMSFLLSLSKSHESPEMLDKCSTARFAVQYLLFVVSATAPSNVAGMRPSLAAEHCSSSRGQNEWHDCCSARFPAVWRSVVTRQRFGAQVGSRCDGPFPPQGSGTTTPRRSSALSLPYC
jgi:hypothetical protein